MAGSGNEPYRDDEGKLIGGTTAHAPGIRQGDDLEEILDATSAEEAAAALAQGLGREARPTGLPGLPSEAKSGSAVESGAAPGSAEGPVGPTSERGRPDEDGNLVDRGGRIDFDGAEDEVEEASEESFPASDPPSYTPNTSIGPPDHGA